MGRVNDKLFPPHSRYIATRGPNFDAIEPYFAMYRHVSVSCVVGYATGWLFFGSECRGLPILFSHCGAEHFVLTCSSDVDGNETGVFVPISSPTAATVGLALLVDAPFYVA